MGLGPVGIGDSDLDLTIFGSCWWVKSRGSICATFTISTFLPEHSFMLKSYGVGGGLVAHMILGSAQVLLVLTLGLQTRA